MWLLSLCNPCLLLAGWFVCRISKENTTAQISTKLSAPKLTFSEEPDKFAFIFFGLSWGYWCLWVSKWWQVSEAPVNSLVLLIFILFRVGVKWLWRTLHVSTYQTLICYHNPASALWLAERDSNCPSGLTQDFSAKVLWCRVLHINYTTDNICDSPRTEVRGGRTPNISVSNRTLWGPVQWQDALLSLIPPVESANIWLQLHFFILRASEEGRAFVSLPSLSARPKMIQLVESRKAF